MKTLPHTYNTLSLCDVFYSSWFEHNAVPPPDQSHNLIGNILLTCPQCPKFLALTIVSFLKPLHIDRVFLLKSWQILYCYHSLGYLELNLGRGLEVTGQSYAKFVRWSWYARTLDMNFSSPSAWICMPMKPTRIWELNDYNRKKLV